MPTLYVTSLNIAGGKTTICAGLADQLKSRGKRVAYMKPLTLSADKPDKDVAFMKQLLSLEERVESLCPVSVDASAPSEGLDETRLAQIKAAHASIAQGKDAVIMEGSGDFAAESVAAKAAVQIVNALGAKAIIVAAFTKDLDAEKILSAARLMADRLLGIVINAVPEREMAKVKSSIVPPLEKQGLTVLGVIPEDRLLNSFSVADLSQYLGGNILNDADKANELVESFMVGAMSVDPAPTYLSAKQNKAVITRGNRPDIQLAALSTSTRCLVLTEGVQPLPLILNRAQEKHTPIMVVNGNTVATMEAIDGAFSQARFRQAKKLDRINALLQKNFQIETIYKAA